MDTVGPLVNGARQAGRTERRRAAWDGFRRAYPKVVATTAVAFLIIFAATAVLFYKRTLYLAEIERLRAGMSVLERERTDVILANTDNRMQVMLELIRRQARGDGDLHLAVSVDSGLMHLEREGASLRDMPIEVGPERMVGMASDTAPMAIPRGTRTIEQVVGPRDAWEVPGWVYAERGLPIPQERTVPGALGPSAIVLSGGSVVYTLGATPPLNDSTYVLPGMIRMRAEDLRAILPNIGVGMRIYFY